MTAELTATAPPIEKARAAPPCSPQVHPHIFYPQNYIHHQTWMEEDPRKWARILHAFLAGRSLNRFEAEVLGEHCLHSTISRLESMGLTIIRYKETVPGYQGRETRLTRYMLELGSDDRARELLGVERIGGEDV